MNYFAFRAGALFLILLLTSFQTAIVGQTTVLTRAQFSRISLLQRARVFEATMARIASEEGVDPYLLWTIGYLETRFRPWLRSPAGALGLMQFIPATAARFNLDNPFEPEPAIRAAARYVRFLSNRFGGRIDSILAGYNAGEGAVDAYLQGKSVRANGKIINPSGIKTIGGVPPYRETRGYVARGIIVYRLLQTRTVFSGVFVSSVYPPAIAASVAGIRLHDPEIGFSGTLLTQISNPKFVNSFSRQNAALQNNLIIPTVQSRMESEAGFLQNSAQNQNIDSNPAKKLVAETEEKKEQPKNSTDAIFYEPRTGFRFRTVNGKLEQLPDSGELVVGASKGSTQLTEIRARGTFFGKKSKTK